MAIAAFGAAAPAAAADLQGILVARTQLVAQCGLRVSDLDFGVYSRDDGARGQATIDLRCTPGVGVQIALDGGGAGDARARRMRGVQDLPYELFQDAGRRRAFGDRDRAEAAELLADGRWQRIPVYGFMPPGLSPEAGSYRDIVTVILTY